MKRRALLAHLRKHGCYLKREGRSHSLWANPDTGHIEAIPRHSEVPDLLARKICRLLRIPAAGKRSRCGSLQDFTESSHHITLRV